MSFMALIIPPQQSETMVQWHSTFSWDDRSSLLARSNADRMIRFVPSWYAGLAYFEQLETNYNWRSSAIVVSSSIFSVLNVLQAGRLSEPGLSGRHRSKRVQQCWWVFYPTNCITNSVTTPILHCVWSTAFSIAYNSW